MTTKDYAEELLREDVRFDKLGNGNYRAAFIWALNSRNDFRKNSKPYRHYNTIIEWMMANWSKELN